MDNYGYNGYYGNYPNNYQRNNFNQNMGQINAPMNTLRQSNMDWIFVQDINQIEQISVMAGQKAWIMVQNEPIFALRTANNMGLVTTEYYRFEKYDKEKSEENQKSNYVTHDEMTQAIEEALKGLKDESTI